MIAGVLADGEPHVRKDLLAALAAADLPAAGLAGRTPS